MLKYLIIPLAGDSVSFCHYSVDGKLNELIHPEQLKEAIFWAMKENLNIQFVFPSYTIPEEYDTVVNSIDHVSIVPSDCEDKKLLDDADIVVLDSWESIRSYPFKHGTSYVVRCTKNEFLEYGELLKAVFPKLDRLVIVITNIDEFIESDFEKYLQTLDCLIPFVKDEYAKGHALHFNLLTDRMYLDQMNNCNAGHESLTLAPGGKFYTCPAFYLDGSEAVGSIEDGLDIKNPQLYRLDHAPLCRKCDVFQCRRCIWLNKRTTLEINTPSHEQCVVAHIERNASRKLLKSIRELGEFLPDKSIDVIDYLDPFEKLIN